MSGQDPKRHRPALAHTWLQVAIGVTLLTIAVSQSARYSRTSSTTYLLLSGWTTQFCTRHSMAW